MCLRLEADREKGRIRENRVLGRKRRHERASQPTKSLYKLLLVLSTLEQK